MFGTSDWSRVAGGLQEYGVISADQPGLLRRDGVASRCDFSENSSCFAPKFTVLDQPPRSRQVVMENGVPAGKLTMLDTVVSVSV